MRAGLATAQEQGVEHRFRHAFALLRHWHVRPQRAVDLPRLVQQHVEHHTVYRAVGAKVTNRLHQWGGLAVAVHPALALLQAVRIPGQVVVEDSREGVLQVDALAQTVGSDKHAAGFTGQLVDFGAALLVAHAARDRDHAQIREVVPQRLLQPFGHILGRGDVAAPEDGVKPLAQQGGNDVSAAGELGVARGMQQRCGKTSKLAQATPIHVHQGGRGSLHRWCGLIVVGPVVGGFEDERAEVRLVLAGGQGIVAGFQRRYRGGRTGHHTA